jgi:xanthine/CO dehydrogenase XdhC/CoxF family maturation factor
VGVVVTQFRCDGNEMYPAVGVQTLRGRRDPRPLTDLLAAAADAAPGRPAVAGDGFTVTFADLRARAQGAAVAMTGTPRIDDSALTVAVMTSIPGLAVSGPGALDETLRAIRLRALIVLAES